MNNVNFGYACINTSVGYRFRTCRKSTFLRDPETEARNITIHNLKVTLKILIWNIENGINFYRITSELIPFSTIPEFTWKYTEDEDFLTLCYTIKDLVKRYNLRLTCHVPQFVVLSSNEKDKIRNSLSILYYHTILMELLGGSDIVTHVGGAYGDKKSAIKRWINEYLNLDPFIKNYLILENDDKTFSLYDTMMVNINTGVPLVVDLHHDRCNPSVKIKEAMTLTQKTWKDRKQKIHISSGKNFERDRSHADFISLDDWKYFKEIIGNNKVDIMIEAKAKEQAVLKLKHHEDTKI